MAAKAMGANSRFAWLEVGRGGWLEGLGAGCSDACCACWLFQFRSLPPCFPRLQRGPPSCCCWKLGFPGSACTLEIFCACCLGRFEVEHCSHARATDRWIPSRETLLIVSTWQASWARLSYCGGSWVRTIMAFKKSGTCALFLVRREKWAEILSMAGMGSKFPGTWVSRAPLNSE